jgi:hypothetical protein
MKQVILGLCLAALAASARSQCIFIYAAEKIKGAEIPIVRTEFEVTINDSLKKKVSSLNDGSLGRISLEKGIYKIKISSSEFADGFQENVIVNASKSTDVVINLRRRGPAETEEKKKSSK